ncbi:peptidase S8 [Gordoniibacillus kamchatkensis]|uniref:Peptidase S8 n=1 Tax=Gordoniibacillus kamchatkensis TaxID=1590651 RepID=A0ABR5AC23_9BACL|nr:S8 family peptidase [Paenibacillus sp. VKM B-2647]KIL38610.1 peptidase S8 [Paenibacillus sp. VKM B-2647]
MDSVRFLERLDDEIGKTAASSRRLIIRFKSRAAYRACITQWKRRAGSFPNLRGIKPLPIINAISCPVRPTASLLAFPFITCAEADRVTTVHAPRPPRAKAAGVAAARRLASLPYIPWGVNQVRAPQAWHKATGGGVRIGVIDTGIDPTHPDLRHCIGRGINLVNRSLLPIDDNGHGTHIAGTIAGSGITPNGVVGVAPRATIHAVKAFDHAGSAYVSDIIAGIDWCVQNDLDIINMSFGMKTYNKSLELAVENAYRAGKVIVASSGNDGKRAFVDYPARFPQVISVGATTMAGKIAPFTNRGRRIDVFAPGEAIYSAWLNGKYHQLSGTSMATSHVSGIIALLLSAQPNLKPLQIKELLKRAATPFPTKKTGITAGRAHARRALTLLLKKKG